MRRKINIERRISKYIDTISSTGNETSIELIKSSISLFNTWYLIKFVNENKKDYRDAEAHCIKKICENIQNFINWNAESLRFNEISEDDVKSLKRTLIGKEYKAFSDRLIESFYDKELENTLWSLVKVRRDLKFMVKMLSVKYK